MRTSLRIWRFPLTQLLVELLAILVTTLIVVAAMTLLVRNFPTGLPVRFFVVIAILATVVLAWKILVNLIEGELDTLYSAEGAVTELILGIFLGFLIVIWIGLLAYGIGVLRITGLQGFGDLWTVAVITTEPAVLEELVFRGIILRHVERMLGTWPALGISSILFGAAHFANPGASLLAVLAITFELGVLLGAAYLCTRRLWLATGLHAAWNFTLGWVLSLPVSGYSAHGFLTTQLIGPASLTGGDFGLEGSLLALVTGVIAGTILLVVAVRRRERHD